jgi:hypothetical protein
MRSVAALWLIVVSLLMAPGCTRPAVAPKVPGFQEQADALRDWEMVARKIADDMASYGFLPNPTSPVRTYPPYYVRVSNAASPFLHEVRQSLQADILRRGGAVASTPNGAAVIALDYSIVQWSPRNRAPDGTGTAAGLAAGSAVLMANQAPLTPAAGFGILAGVGIAADIARTLIPNTDTELAWEASITQGDRIVFDVRYPMYIHDADVALYAGVTPVPPIVGPPPVQVLYRP